MPSVDAEARRVVIHWDKDRSVTSPSCLPTKCTPSISLSSVHWRGSSPLKSLPRPTFVVSILKTQFPIPTNRISYKIAAWVINRKPVKTLKGTGDEALLAYVSANIFLDGKCQHLLLSGWRFQSFLWFVVYFPHQVPHQSSRHIYAHPHLHCIQKYQLCAGERLVRKPKLCCAVTGGHYTLPPVHQGCTIQLKCQHRRTGTWQSYPKTTKKRVEVPC